MSTPETKICDICSKRKPIDELVEEPVLEHGEVIAVWVICSTCKGRMGEIQ